VQSVDGRGRVVGWYSDRVIRGTGSPLLPLLTLCDGRLHAASYKPGTPVDLLGVLGVSVVKSRSEIEIEGGIEIGKMMRDRDA